MYTRLLIKCFFIFLFFSSFGQHNENFSGEINANYTYYYISNKRINYFNYGFSALLSYRTDKFKFSSGINYSTKNSYYRIIPNVSNNFLEKRDYEIQYINIPVLYTFGEQSLKKINFGLVSGIIFNYIVNYDITSYYLNSTPTFEDNVKSGQKTGISLRLGTNISKYINDKISINLSPFIDYKFEFDHKNYYYRPDYRQLTDDRLSFGFIFGIEYLF